LRAPCQQPTGGGAGWWEGTIEYTCGKLIGRGGARRRGRLVQCTPPDRGRPCLTALRTTPSGPIRTSLNLCSTTVAIGVITLAIQGDIQQSKMHTTRQQVTT
jgi:hypothetical protein